MRRTPEGIATTFARRLAEPWKMAAAATLLGGLLAQEGALTAEARAGLEGKLQEALSLAVSFAFGALAAPASGPGRDPKAAYRLCKFLVSVTEADESAGFLSPEDASVVLRNLAMTHPGSEDVQNCARWLWWLVSPAGLLPELQAAVQRSDTVLPVRAALWAVPDLARRKRLPEAQQFVPWVIRAMAGAHGADERVQLYAAEALLALCGRGGTDAGVDIGAGADGLGAALENALVLHVGHWDVVEKLLEASAWTLRLAGHVRFLSNQQLTANVALLKRLLADIGARRNLEYGPEEVARCGAVAAVVKAAEAATEDVSRVAMCALWGLLDKVADLGADADPVLLQGAGVVVHALLRSAASSSPPESELVRDTFGVILVLAACNSVAITQPLREYRELIKGMLEATLKTAKMRHHELVTCCRLVVALWSVGDLVGFVEHHASNVGLLQAACCAINEGVYEVEEVRPCAAAIMRIALQFLGALTVRECSADTLSAPAAVLGLAVGHIDCTTAGSQDLIRLALQHLLHLMEFGIELAATGFQLLYYTNWAIREAVAGSEYARAWVMSCPQAYSLLENAVHSLVQDASGRAPADESDSEARRAFMESFSTLTLLQGPRIAVLAMNRCPGSRAVQAAGCAALRDAVQRGMLDAHCEEAREALRKACRICEDEPEVETAACVALGLLGG